MHSDYSSIPNLQNIKKVFLAPHLCTHDDKKFSVTFTNFIQVLMRNLELLSPYWLGKLRILLPSAPGIVHLNIASAENSSDKRELGSTKKRIQISIFMSF